MSEFWVYFELGITHILDWRGYDHMLFLLALIANLSVTAWRKITMLITAFTLGHCLTLILSARGWFSADAALVEVLIAFSIVVTAILNLLPTKMRDLRIHYLITLGFGLIHGLGFSGYLRALLQSDEALWRPLLYFNLGVEVGQIAFVLVILALNYLFLRLFKVPMKYWTVAISLIALFASVAILVDRL